MPEGISPARFFAIELNPRLRKRQKPYGLLLKQFIAISMQGVPLATVCTDGPYRGLSVHNRLLLSRETTPPSQQRTSGLAACFNRQKG